MAGPGGVLAGVVQQNFRQLGQLAMCSGTALALGLVCAALAQYKNRVAKGVVVTVALALGIAMVCSVPLHTGEKICPKN